MGRGSHRHHVAGRPVEPGQSRILTARKRSDEGQELVRPSLTEHIRPFGVSRAGQTDEQNVADVKTAERDFGQLLTDLQKSRQQLSLCSAAKLRYANHALAAYIEGRLGYLNAMHHRAVETARRACRIQYVNAVTRIMQDSEKHRDRTLVTILHQHQARISEMNTVVFSLKREARRRADRISKLRSKVARRQIVLKKNGINCEGEIDLCITDERLHGEESLERLKFQMSQREEKIADLTEQVVKLEITTAERSAERKEAAAARLLTAQREQQAALDRAAASVRASRVAAGVRASAVAVIPEAAEPLSPPESTSLRPDENLLETMIADLTATYEARLEQMRMSHAIKMAALASDTEQNSRDLEMQYINAKQRLEHTESIQNQIRAVMEQQGSVREVVRKLFPRGQKAGCVNRGTQCSLDPTF
ncbi:hypothetical protein BDZ88DRAFT_404804 [Geranomyces variabilis]|nr:hypothetical protein BDZ88DRAFT_404804 [Geranomyces variabilis]